MVLVTSLVFDQPVTLWINILFVALYLASRVWKFTRSGEPKDATRWLALNPGAGPQSSYLGPAARAGVHSADRSASWTSIRQAVDMREPSVVIC